MKKIKKMAFIAIFAAVEYAVFTFAKIDIPLAANSSVAIHFANAVVVLGGLLLGPVEGGLAGAIGLSIADVLDPKYITSAPKTFFLKFMIAFIAGSIAKKMKLSEKEDRKEIMRITFFSALGGLGFNVIFDPIIGYLFKRFILSVSAEVASIILTWTGGVTAFNAVVCLFVSVALYLALYKPFQKIAMN